MKKTRIKWKRAAAILICCSMAVTLVGCGEQAAKTKDDEAVMTIKWLGVPYAPNANVGTQAQKTLEEKFNIKIDPIFLDMESYNNKKPMLLASGDVPDIIYEMDPSNVQGDVSQGFLMEVPYSMIKEKAPNIYAELNKIEPRVWMYAYCNDKNYGVPNIYYTGAAPKVGMWRLDWLKNVGIDKVPETLDKMHEAFVKFANDDPDRNGKKDTYGMSGDIKAWYTTFTDIFGAYGNLPFDWMEKDGKVVYGGLQPETKAALATLQTWYKEGVIDPDFITDDVQKSGLDKFKNGQVGFINSGGSYAQMNPETKGGTMNVLKQLNSNAEIAASQPVKGPEGKAGTFAWGKGGHVIAFGKHMEKEPEKLDKIFKMLEYMSVNQDFALQLRIGQKGVHYELKDETMGLAGGLTALPPYDNISTAEKELISTSGFGGFSYFTPIQLKQETLDTLALPQDKEFRSQYVDESKGLTDAFLKPDTLPSSAQYLGDLRNKQMIVIAAVIRGEKKVDDYDEFLTIWNNEGGAVLEKEANEMLASRRKVYQELGIQ